MSRSPHNPGRAAVALLLAGLVWVVPTCSPAPLVDAERPREGAGGAAGGGPPPGANAGGSGGVAPITRPDAAPPGAAETSGPACAEETHEAKAVPVDLLLLVDRSGSMADRVEQGGVSKWTVAQGALTKFVRDTRSAGLGVGLQFF
ncbi:MAG TPA: hypothetical protein VGF45_09925, partial [Polyangia bacterium]